MAIFCLNIAAALPALILFLVGLSRINASGGRLKGTGLAIGGLAAAAAGTLASCVGLVGIGSAYLARVAYEKVDKQSSNSNLQQIAIAFQAYEDDNHHFPAAAIYDKDGVPLLSWRVALLPYLGERGFTTNSISRKHGMGRRTASSCP